MADLLLSCRVYEFKAVAGVCVVLTEPQSYAVALKAGVGLSLARTGIKLFQTESATIFLYISTANYTIDVLLGPY